MIMGCGKSKHSVATDDGALQKGESTDGENLKLEIGGKRDNVDAEALSCPEEATESQEMSLLPREEGAEHEVLGQKEEQEVEKKDETLEEKKGATLEEEKDASLEDEHRDGSKGLAVRPISRDSPDHNFSSRKDDEALERILSEYNSPLHVDANKPTQEVPVDGKLETKEEPAVAAIAEPMISAVEPKVLTADGDQTNPAPSA